MPVCLGVSCAIHCSICRSNISIQSRLSNIPVFRSAPSLGGRLRLITAIVMRLIASCNKLECLDHHHCHKHSSYSAQHPGCSDLHRLQRLAQAAVTCADCRAQPQGTSLSMSSLTTLCFAVKDNRNSDACKPSRHSGLNSKHC